MKKMTMKGKIVEVDVFSADVAIAVGPFDQLLPWAKKTKMSKRCYESLKKQIENGVRKEVLGRMFPLFGGASIIWLPQWQWSIFVHEVFHATVHMLQSKGIELVSESDGDNKVSLGTEETYAYLIEFLFRKLRPALTRESAINDAL